MDFGRMACRPIIRRFGQVIDAKRKLNVDAGALLLVETLDRRRLLKFAGGAGLAIAGSAAWMGSPVAAHQDAAAAPELGPQEDGTNLWRVVVGGMDMENAIEYHGFFPGEITINAGDSIWFAYDMPMFHSVTFPDANGVPPLFMPDPEVEASGTPAAGPPKLIVNPMLLTGVGDGTVDGSQLVSTPNDVFDMSGAPWVFTFPVAGTFDYVCVPHADVMQGRVIVQEAGSDLPTEQAAYDQVAAEQMAALQAEGLAQIELYSTATQSEKDGGGVLWEAAVGASGPTQARVQRFLPGEMTVSAGDSIRYVIQSPGEPHTVTFLGEGETAPVDFVEETFADGSLKLVQSPDTFLPSGGNTWSGAGFVNSGFMGIPALEVPMEFEVLFDTPGEYVVYCILHGSPDGSRMAGKVIVTE